MYSPYKKEDLVEKEIEDFWPGVIAYGFPTYVNGTTGLGKTNVFLKVGADATRGIFEPGIQDGYLTEPVRAEPIRMLYVSTENPVHEIVYPALRYNGADDDMYKIQNEADGHFELNTEDLQAAMDDFAPRLIIVDAFQEHLPKGYNFQDWYGMSELMGPGVSGECLEHCGLHINEDYFLPEIIDPKTGEVLPAGEQGELVITCIKKEGIPLIRYRTKDITRLFYEKCKCGRTFCRMENLSGRSDDMLKIRGVNVFPSQIEEVILSVEELGPHYEIILEREGYLDKLSIRVELLHSTDSFKELEALSGAVRSKLRTVLGLDAKILLESPNTLQRFEGKAKRIKDLRKK